VKNTGHPKTAATRKRRRRLWVEALRSGRFGQTRGRLRNGDAFCCLGVMSTKLPLRPEVPTCGGSNMRDEVFCGVDPGLDGGIAAILPGSPMPFLVDMPTLTIGAKTAGGRSKRVLDVAKLRSIFWKLRADSKCKLCHEHTSPQPHTLLVDGKTMIGPACNPCPDGKDHGKVPNIFVTVESAQMRSAIFPTQPPHRCHCGRECMTVGQGMASLGSFMKQYGEIIGLLVGLGVPHEVVAPQTWKKDVFRGVGGSDKDAARQKAMQVFPVLAERLKLKKSHGLAEAVLLAHYGMRRGGNAPF
jgi:hypothetical protein